MEDERNAENGSRNKFLYFEIAALFPSLPSRVKSAAISKQTNFFCQSRRSCIVFSLVSTERTADISRAEWSKLLLPSLRES